MRFRHRIRVIGARLPCRLCGEEGFTLTEMITVMAILGIVLGGLTTMFHAGMRAELRASREYEAQQTARLALDALRRELHCASAVSAANGVAVSSITVTLPDGCSGTDTSVTYATQSVSASRYELQRTGSVGTVVVADYVTTADLFTYYVPATGTLGRLRVEIPVNINPSDAGTQWTLADDIVLRNTDRL